MHDYERIRKAVEFAMEYHKLQGRKIKDAYYFWHVFGVGRLLDECGASEEEVIAGILHDLLEDTEVDEEEIMKHFGQEVLRIVKGVTVPHNTGMKWEERKKRMLKQIKEGDVKIKRVKLMDVLDNVLELYRDRERFGEGVWNKFRAPKEKQKWYYYELLKIFKEAEELKNESFYISLLEEYLAKLFE